MTLTGRLFEWQAEHVVCLEMEFLRCELTPNRCNISSEGNKLTLDIKNGRKRIDHPVAVLQMILPAGKSTTMDVCIDVRPDVYLASSARKVQHVQHFSEFTLATENLYFYLFYSGATFELF